MQSSYQSKILDHLGLVAAMFDELEIGERIDQMLPQDFARRGVTLGQAAKAMVLNGPGFVNQRLYLVPRFFETNPTERIIGEDVLPEHLNDDTLGRALDSFYDSGVTELFREAQKVAAFSQEFMLLYLEAALVYWVLTIIFSYYQERLEQRMARGDR